MRGTKRDKSMNWDLQVFFFCLYNTCIYLIPPPRSGYWDFKHFKAVLNSKLSIFLVVDFAEPKLPSLLYYLLIYGGRGDSCLFLRALALSKTRTALSRFWTEVTDSISYDDNHYDKCALSSNDIHSGIFTGDWKMLPKSRFIRLNSMAVQTDIKSHIQKHFI